MSLSNERQMCILNTEMKYRKTLIKYHAYLKKCISFLNIDKQPQNAASDQGLHCLLTESSMRILLKMKNKI